VAKLFASGIIWRHLWVTLAESMLAFALGATAGVLIGFWFARKPTIAAVFDPYLKMINALPRVVFFHAVVRPRHLVEGRAWRHAGLLYRVLQRVPGRQGGEPDRARQCAHARHERPRADAPCLLAIRAVVDVFVAAHFGRFAVVGAVVGEYLGSAAGLGYLIQQAEGIFDVAGVFAGMFILAVFVLAINGAVTMWNGAFWCGGRTGPRRWDESRHPVGGKNRVL
jgi:NitT/TauT family transport system permease protein